MNKYLLKKYNFSRTKKPIYNYAIFGPEEKEILNLEQSSAFGKDSVIGYLSMHQATALGIVELIHQILIGLLFMFVKKYVMFHIDFIKNFLVKILIPKRTFQKRFL